MSSLDRVSRILGHLCKANETNLNSQNCDAKPQIPKGSKFTLDDFRLDGRVACVTGASRGIGAQFARAFAAIGACVVITSRNQKDCDETAQEIRDETGGKCIGFAFDVSDESSCRKAISFCVETFGGLDILVNNAGIFPAAKDLEGYKGADLDKVWGVNLRGPAQMCIAAIPELKKSKHGRIINVSSIASVLGIPQRVAYCASKSGLDGLTRALAKELAEYKITVNTVLPGAIFTQLYIDECDNSGLSLEETVETYGASIPIGRFGDLKELSGVGVWLASDLGSYTTGVSILVDGGWGC